MREEKFASSTLSDFVELKELYRSTGGAVYRARFKYDNKVYVLKERKVAELGRRKDIMNEVKLLQQLRHQNIVQCEGWFRDLINQSLFIVLEYCDGGDLNTMIETRRKRQHFFQEQDIWFIFYHVCCGVKHLHEHGIVHRDIKALNILMHKQPVANHATSHPSPPSSCSFRPIFKVSDLGVSRQISERTAMLNTFYGTPLYISPEIVENKSYNEKTDIWSLGVLLYELSTLNPPFYGRNLVQVTKSITSGIYDKEPLSRYSKDIAKCIRWLLQKEYANRPNIAQLIDMVSAKLSPSYKGENLVDFSSQPSIPTAFTAFERERPSSAPKNFVPTTSQRKVGQKLPAADAQENNPSDEEDIDEDSLGRGNESGGEDTASDTDDDDYDDEQDGKNMNGRRNQYSSQESPPKREINLQKAEKVENVIPFGKLNIGLEVRIPFETRVSENIPVRSIQSDVEQSKVRHQIDQPLPPKPQTKPENVPKTADIAMEIDKMRCHMKHRKEGIRYRKLLQIRDYFSGGKSKESNIDTDINSILSQINEVKRNILLLEEAIDKGIMLQSYAIILDVLPRPKVESPRPETRQVEEQRIQRDDTLPVYLQPPPRRPSPTRRPHSAHCSSKNDKKVEIKILESKVSNHVYNEIPPPSKNNNEEPKPRPSSAIRGNNPNFFVNVQADDGSSNPSTQIHNKRLHEAMVYGKQKRDDNSPDHGLLLPSMVGDITSVDRRGVSNRSRPKSASVSSKRAPSDTVDSNAKLESQSKPSNNVDIINPPVCVYEEVKLRPATAYSPNHYHSESHDSHTIFSDKDNIYNHQRIFSDVTGSNPRRSNLYSKLKASDLIAPSSSADSNVQIVRKDESTSCAAENIPKVNYGHKKVDTVPVEQNPDIGYGIAFEKHKAEQKRVRERERSNFHVNPSPNHRKDQTTQKNQQSKYNIITGE